MSFLAWAARQVTRRWAEDRKGPLFSFFPRTDRSPLSWFLQGTVLFVSFGSHPGALFHEYMTRAQAFRVCLVSSKLIARSGMLVPIRILRATFHMVETMHVQHGPRRGRLEGVALPVPGEPGY